MLGLTIKQLETFVAVAETGGFRRAADRLNLSQSAVTAHVRALEDQLGVPLFHRTTRSVRLTESGETLLAQAGRTLAGLEETVHRFRDEAAVRRGRVTLATAPSFASSLLPGILASFHARFPDIAVQVVEAFGPDILTAVGNHTADFGVGPIDGVPAAFAVDHLLTDSFKAIVAPGHDLSGRTSVSLSALARHALLVMPRLSETRRTLDAAFAARGLALEPAYEMLHHQTLIAMAEAGVGIGILPGIALEGAGQSLCHPLEISAPQLTRKIGILTLRGQALSPAAKAMANAITHGLGPHPALAG